jgi:cytochrome c oxidase assembly protein subunit 15
MVLVGGITRLTGSGLSITEWKLVHGVVPPLNEKAWQEEFDNYRQIPQFKNLNYRFTLADFKDIYWWEYVHRLLGRLIGLVFAGPFIWFYFKGLLSRRLALQLLFLFALGGLQGFLGWYMVQSGLQGGVYVSHVRLAVHLVTAFITFGVTLLIALNLVYRKPVSAASPAVAWRGFAVLLLCLILAQVVYGALVAGLRAGEAYNTFPSMNGQWLPDAVGGAMAQGRAWIHHAGLVQFVHRMLAWLLAGLGLALFIGHRKKVRSFPLNRRWGMNGLLLALTVQFLLGVSTLLLHVPVGLALAHQAGAFFVFGFAVLFLHSLYREK